MWIPEEYTGQACCLCGCYTGQPILQGEVYLCHGAAESAIDRPDEQIKQARVLFGRTEGDRYVLARPDLIPVGAELSRFLKRQNTRAAFMLYGQYVRRGVRHGAQRQPLMASGIELDGLLSAAEYGGAIWLQYDIARLLHFSPVMAENVQMQAALEGYTCEMLRPDMAVIRRFIGMGNLHYPEALVVPKAEVLRAVERLADELK